MTAESASHTTSGADPENFFGGIAGAERKNLFEAMHVKFKHIPQVCIWECSMSLMFGQGFPAYMLNLFVNSVQIDNEKYSLRTVLVPCRLTTYMVQ